MVEKKIKVKLLTDKERGEMDRKIAEQKHKKKKTKQAQKQLETASKSAKRRKPSGQGSLAQSQARDFEGSDAEFLKTVLSYEIIF